MSGAWFVLRTTMILFVCMFPGSFATTQCQSVQWCLQVLNLHGWLQEPWSLHIVYEKPKATLLQLLSTFEGNKLQGWVRACISPQCLVCMPVCAVGMITQ
jgi:hypothetical protein